MNEKSKSKSQQKRTETQKDLSSGAAQEGVQENGIETDELGLHRPTIAAIVEVIYEEKQRLKKEIERMQSLGNTGRYRSPHYMGVGKAVWPVRSIIDMESEAMACLDTLEKTLRALSK